jgi:putative flavoprotein involved in K+ transport
MPTVTVVVVGAGPAGLAVSNELSTRGVDHVVLDRGRTAESWRSRRWDSLRLLSPAWATRLPGLPPAPDPDAFLTAAELVDVLDRYAADGAAPVVEYADVLSVRRCDDRYRVVSTAGTWTASAVVLATGDAAVPAVPAAGRHLPRDVHQLAPDTYRRPSQLPDGGVLVVGASASGVQLADELAASGRKVVLAVGRHTRMVRTYRGVDVYWWMQRLGSLDRSIDNTADHEAALSEPSLQLAGQGPSARRPRDLSLPALAARGVRLTGRVTGASGGLIFLADDLLHTTAAADARFARFLERVDRHVRDTGLQGEVLDAGPAPARLPSTTSPTELSLAESGIRTVVWATGYRRSHPWLHVPVLELGGDVVHRHGVTASPGLYVVGWRWQTKRSSSFLAGMGADATSVVSDLVRRLDRHRAQQVVHLSRQEHTS